MRVVFMGTPEASVPSLVAVAEQHEVAAVYTQPDRPKGRGLTEQPSAVKQAAERLGLPVIEPATMKDDAELDRLRSFAADAAAVVAFGHILPPGALQAARLGCVNVHFSLLPRWRGAAPVERAIMSGDTVTGITTMLMDEGLDTGPILLQCREPIRPDDTAGTLLDRLSVAGAEELVRTLGRLEAGDVVPKPQPEGAATYARKLSSSEAELTFNLEVRRLADLVRAMNPQPGAFTWFRSSRLKVWKSRATEGSGTPGTIAAITPDGPEVQARDGRFVLLEVQPEGKKVMSGPDFVNGYRPARGEQLGSPG
ncbi:MAG TPA: methionyl-tRNA formyltransferase [Actinomycetota bacterium]|nr:methionyl-tRNA formyltransferase [Actinomycetota bacterium]